MEELVKMLKGLAKQDMRSDNDDFNPMDASGDNYDDAYSMGLEDGVVFLARRIIKEFFNKES